MGLRVLVVDDDPAFRRLARTLLEQDGHGVVEAGTAAEALSRAAERFELAIVDPAVSDAPSPRWVANLTEGGLVSRAVVVSTTWREVRDFSRWKTELGIALLVHKPVLPEVFSEQLRRLLGNGAPSGECQPGVLVALARDYAQSLPGEVAELEAAYRRAADRSPERIAELSRLAHRLHGTAGSFGVPEVSELAGRIEALLGRLCGAEATAGGIWQELGTLVARLGSTAAAAGVPAPWDGAPTSITREKVLVVDADPAFLAFALEAGRRDLFEVTTACEPREALETAAATAPDILIVGVRRGEDERSFELARSLRRLPGLGSVPLAFTSDDARVNSRIAAAHAGASLFLLRPLDASAFVTALRQLSALRQADRPRVLVVDDDVEFLELAALVLRQDGMWVRTMSDPAGILEVMEETPPDVVLLDLIMPGISGYDVCRMLRISPRWQSTPVIFVTGRDGQEGRLAAFRAGGDDYLVKPVMPEEMLVRIRSTVERARLLKERMDKDSLTGLLLRRAFLDGVAARLSESQRHDRPLTLALLDLDHFKHVNDHHGHLAGDRVLAQLGRLLSCSFRAEDLRGRWGGEEFVLAFPGEASETIARVLERVLGEFSSLDFRGEKGEPFHVTFSAGVASYPQDGAQVDALLRVADRRLYRAKDGGRARILSGG